MYTVIFAMKSKAPNNQSFFEIVFSSSTDRFVFIIIFKSL